jgi:para-aminobenzoate synthetase / 4-amino-4-deoxychorismate lyase
MRSGSAADARGSPAAAVAARFDSLRGGRSVEMLGPMGVIVADEPGAVVPALREVEREVGRGRHVAGFVTYEAAPGLNPVLRAPHASGLPLVWFAVFRGRRDGPPGAPVQGTGTFELGEWAPRVDRAGYAARVERIRDWIAAGDTYQVNYTFLLEARFAGEASSMYRHLCLSQQAGYCALLQTGDVAIASASPELFFRWTGDQLELRPMKGTRPRGRWSEEDRARVRELLASEKERAENLMIVDLLRNDAGRVAKYGSVMVDPLFEVETYPTVHQLTSTVRARTRPGTSLTDLFRTLFPSGSVTGAPKVRTMQIIADLEPHARGVYTGAIGFASPGEAVFNVPIRTVVVDEGAGVARMGVGSGVTYDSRADAEYRECLQKALFTHHATRNFDLLETMLWTPGAGIRLRLEHLSRIQESARYFGIPFDRAAVERLLDERLLGQAAPLRVRLLVSRQGRVSVERHPLGAPAGVLRARVDRDPVDSRDVLLYHKTTWRQPYDTRLTARPGYDEVLLVNERGELTEFANGSLVLRDGSGSWTPPLSCGVLPGTLRGELLRQGEIRERILYPADLSRAAAVFRINSVRGFTPVEVEGFGPPAGHGE